MRENKSEHMEEKKFKKKKKKTTDNFTCIGRNML